MENNFRDLSIWNRSLAIATLIYQITNEFPLEERYGLTSQIRSSIVSIPSKISEGLSIKNSKKFSDYLSIVSGSINKLETQLIIAYELAFLEEKDLKHLENELAELKIMIYGFQRKILEPIN